MFSFIVKKTFLFTALPSLSLLRIATARVAAPSIRFVL